MVRAVPSISRPAAWEAVTAVSVKVMVVASPAVTVLPVSGGMVFVEALPEEAGAQPVSSPKVRAKESVQFKNFIIDPPV